MSERVSVAATLGGMPGRGYLAVETTGYRRAEGVFFTQLANRAACLRYIVDNVPAVYRGVLVGENADERPFSGDVYVRSVSSEAGRLRVRIQALGSY